MKRIVKWGIAMFAFLTAFLVIVPQVGASVPNDSVGSITIVPTTASNAGTVGTGESDESITPAVEGIIYEIRQTHELFTASDGTSTLDEATGVASEWRDLGETTESGVTENIYTLGRYEIRQKGTTGNFLIDPRVYVVDMPMTNPDGDDHIYDIFLYPKLEEITVTKSWDLHPEVTATMFDVDGESESEEKPVLTNSALVGDQVDYTITTTIPFDIAEEFEYTLASGVTDTEHVYQKITIIDELDERLTFVANSGTFNIVAGANFAAWQLDYDIEVVGRYVTAIINNPWILEPGSTVTFTFSVMINTNALEDLDNYNLNPIKNTADVIFTTFGGELNPDDTKKLEESDPITPETPAIIDELDTGSIELTKIDSRYRDDVINGLLNDASFTLYKVYDASVDVLEATTTEGDSVPDSFLSITNSDLGLIPGTQIEGYVFGYGTTGANDPKGIINWNELPLGTYYLVETKAPSGFNLLRTPIEVTVSRTYSEVQTTVQNIAEGVIPATGGTGTLLFTVIGLGLMGGATYVLRKRDNKEETSSEE